MTRSTYPLIHLTLFKWKRRYHHKQKQQHTEQNNKIDKAKQANKMNLHRVKKTPHCHVMDCDSYDCITIIEKGPYANVDHSYRMSFDCLKYKDLCGMPFSLTICINSIKLRTVNKS